MTLDQAAPEVIDEERDVTISDKTVGHYDAVFADIPVKNAVFGRVLLEMIQEENVTVNYPSTAFFTMAKKNYLYHVLHQKNVSAAKTVVIASGKSARNIEKVIDTPVIGRKLEELEETEKKKLEDEEEIRSFVEGVEYEEDLIIFHPYNDGDKYRCLVTEKQVIALKDSSEEWSFNRDSLKYSNPSDEETETVKKALSAIGAPIAEVVLRGGEVYDVNPNPDLELYKNLAGKNVYETAADVLKGDEA